VNLSASIRNYLVFQGLLLMLVAGCATWHTPAPAEGGFVSRGKLGVVAGEESFSARYLWQQDGAAFVIDLWGPLGQGRVQLAGDGTLLELREGDGTVVDRGPPAAVMQRHLGWSLPLSVLPQWVRGNPAPGRRVSGREFDDAGRLAAFRQLGWTVELERYRPVTEPASASAPAADGAAGQAVTVSLPHRITARQGDYRVRLAVSTWQI
jgi:outer membrane lipoprotein LolB